MKKNRFPFGFYKANFKLKLVLFLVKLGLGRGRLKNKISNFSKIFLGESPIDVVYQDLKFRLYPYGNTIENKILFSSKTREQVELEVLKRFLTPQSIFLDIGANVGYYSLNIAKHGVKKIIAVEPNFKVIPRLKDNIDFNNYNNIISVCEKCLSNKKEELVLTIPNSDMGSSSAVEGKVIGEEIKLNCITLKDFLIENSIQYVDAIKIDVEGLEDKILLPYFESVQAENYPLIIIIEDNSDDWDRNVLHWLLEHNYYIYSQTNSNVILRYKT